eukprot:UN04844
MKLNPNEYNKTMVNQNIPKAPFKFNNNKNIGNNNTNDDDDDNIKLENFDLFNWFQEFVPNGNDYLLLLQHHMTTTGPSDTMTSAVFTECLLSYAQRWFGDGRQVDL